MNIQEYISSGEVEACILGVATEAEQLHFMQMKKNYTEVAQYANEFELSLEKKYLENAPLTPNANLFASIQKELSPEAPVISIKKANTTNTEWKKYTVAASIALLLGSTIFNFMLLNKVKGLQTQVNDLANNKTTAPQDNKNTAQFAFLQSPNVTPVAMYGVGTHNICKCSIFWDKAKNVALFVTHHLFQPGENNDYQLWAMVDNKPVSVGIVKLPLDKAPILIENIPVGATQFKLTLEKKGGSVKPTLEQLYLDGKIST